MSCETLFKIEVSKMRVKLVGETMQSVQDILKKYPIIIAAPMAAAVSFAAQKKDTELQYLIFNGPICGGHPVKDGVVRWDIKL